MSYSNIGFGQFGQALARTFARQNLNVTVASRSAPKALAARARATGSMVVPKTLQDAIAADSLFLAIPFWEHRTVAKALPSSEGETLIDSPSAYGTPVADLVQPG